MSKIVASITSVMALLARRINMNDLNDRRNMIVMLIVIGILSAVVIGMLLSVPSVLKSKAANLQENNNNSSNNTNGIIISSSRVNISGG